jgi:homocysteine S-methyltransferase
MQWLFAILFMHKWLPSERIVVSKYRSALPQLGGDLFLADGGIETTLIFLDGHELPYFAAFDLLKSTAGEVALRNYFLTYAELARRFNTGLVLETATWRASADWGDKLGYDATSLATANVSMVRMLEQIRSEYESPQTPFVISGCIGPRGDGYIPDSGMSAIQAEQYHRPQIETFAGTTADLVSAITMNYAEEAVGLALAAKQAGMPVVIAFTVETDGQLPTGQSLGAAIQQVDAATSGYPAYYMINCAHPSHFDHVLRGDEPWLARIRGLRANASRMSHAELNEAPELDAGVPSELGQQYAALKTGALSHLNVLGGCCGTDQRHIEQIALACAPLFLLNN